jgi:uncharacterized protein (DUF849 family)
MSISDQAPDWTPLIIAVAPNGARKTKADHPALPMTAPEIAADAEDCLAAGAAMIHLHVRDGEGRHTLSVEAYREAIGALRDRLGDNLIIQATSEAVGVYEPEQQMAMVRELKPEAVSLALRELLPAGADQGPFADFAHWVAQEAIMAQWILYSADDLRRFQDLRAQDVIPDDNAARLYVLGRYSVGQRSEPADLLAFLAAASGDDPWAICAFGPKEAAAGLTAAALGGHVRVGFENNLRLPDGTLAPDNAASVAAAAAGARAIGRPLADAAQARAILRAHVGAA